MATANNTTHIKSNNAKAADDYRNSPVCRLCNKLSQREDRLLLLPCLHFFCKPCLREYTQTKPSVKNLTSCPACAAPFSFTEDVKTLLFNPVRVADMKEEVSVRCQVCSTVTSVEQAAFFCFKCCRYLCLKCKAIHLHEVFLSDEQCNSLVLSKVNVPVQDNFKTDNFPSKCQLHVKQDVIAFCEDCTMLVCQICVWTDHHNHRIESLPDDIDNDRTVLTDHTTDVQEALDKIDQALQKIQQMRGKVKIDVEKVTGRINKACDDLIEVVEKRRNALHTESQEIAKEKDRALLKHFGKLQITVNDLSVTQSDIVSTMNNQATEEVSNVKKAVKDQLKQATELHQQQEELLDNCATAPALDINPLLCQIQDIGSFPNISSTFKCLVDGSASPQVIDHKERQISASLEDEVSQPVKGEVHSQYHAAKE